MTMRGSAQILLACRAGTLVRLPGLLARSGLAVRRVETLRLEAVPARKPPAWLHRRPPGDLWVVTSRGVVDTFLRVHPDWVEALRRVPRVVAVGPGTRRALAGAGIPRAEVASDGGARELLRALGPVRGLLVIYLHSDRAGHTVTRVLRRRGARVRERTVYRVRETEPATDAELARLLVPTVWAVSSPSALRGLRRALGRDAFERRLREVQCFALGERTAEALRHAGARRLVTSRPSTEEGLTKALAQMRDDAADEPARRRHHG
jgi:uroporphyrinogen-III synthase